jgi:CheY-like chemotaxis protein
MDGDEKDARTRVDGETGHGGFGLHREPEHRAETRDETAPEAKRILVVDDDSDAALSLAMILELQGHMVHTAKSAMSALRLARQVDFDIVVLDVGLPDLDGYTLGSRLRSLPRGAQLLLIAFTGHGLDEDVERSRSVGIDHHVTKPGIGGLLRLIAQAGANGAS